MKPRWRSRSVGYVDLFYICFSSLTIYQTYVTKEVNKKCLPENIGQDSVSNYWFKVVLNIETIVNGMTWV